MLKLYFVKTRSGFLQADKNYKYELKARPGNWNPMYRRSAEAVTGTESGGTELKCFFYRIDSVCILSAWIYESQKLRKLCH